MLRWRRASSAAAATTVTPGVTPGVHVSLSALAALEHRSRILAPGTRHPLHAMLAGVHDSRIRGRGLDFRELRYYLPGDDVRAIDWRVSVRTGHPHVRVYAEERDRPVMLVVDQRLNMFFATRRAMKSVVAAEAAALLGWSLRRSGDPIGALVFDDRDDMLFAPHRGRAGWLRILGEIARRNAALHAESTQPQAPGMLDRILAGLLRTLSPGHLIVLLSDFDGMGTGTPALVGRLASQHALIAMPVRDPGADVWPERGLHVVGDGHVQLALTGGDRKERDCLAAAADAHRERVARLRSELAVPLLELTTAEDVAPQLQRAFAVDPGLQIDAR